MFLKRSRGGRLGVLGSHCEVVMKRVDAESPVSLEKLDAHLKALLRLKVREFVYMSPWFRDIPSIDPVAYPASAAGPGANKSFEIIGFEPHRQRKAQAHHSVRRQRLGVHK